MKNLWTTLSAAALLAACIVSASCLATPRPPRSIKGNGNLVTKKIPIPAFDAISASRSVKVRLTEEASDIRIDADENLMEWVVVESSNGELQITIDPKVKEIRRMDVTVTVPVAGREIRRLRASSAARIEGEVTIHSPECTIEASSAARIATAVQADKCRIEASSASRIELAAVATQCRIEASSAARIIAGIQSELCEVDLSSTARIELSGRTKELSANANSAAEVRAKALDTQETAVKASSASRIEVTCSESLKAEATSGASVRYGGACRVSSNTSSGGSIRQR